MKYEREYLTIEQAIQKAPTGATHYMAPSDEWHGSFLMTPCDDYPLGASMNYPNQSIWYSDHDVVNHITYGRAVTLK